MRRYCIFIASLTAVPLIAGTAVAASVSGTYVGSTSQHQAFTLVIRHLRDSYPVSLHDAAAGFRRTGKVFFSASR